MLSLSVMQGIYFPSTEIFRRVSSCINCFVYSRVLGVSTYILKRTKKKTKKLNVARLILLRTKCGLPQIDTTVYQQQIGKNNPKRQVGNSFTSVSSVHAT